MKSKVGGKPEDIVSKPVVIEIPFEFNAYSDDTFNQVLNKISLFNHRFKFTSGPKWVFYDITYSIYVTYINFKYSDNRKTVYRYKSK